jgi:hypothetical protein
MEGTKRIQQQSQDDTTQTHHSQANVIVPITSARGRQDSVLNQQWVQYLAIPASKFEPASPRANAIRLELGDLEDQADVVQRILRCRSQQEPRETILADIDDDVEPRPGEHARFS